MSAETPIRGLTPWLGANGAARPVLRRLLKSAAILLCPLGLTAQAPMGNAPRINATDMAVLEAHEVRKDLACTVTPNKPELGFDLRFHGGFDVSVPLNELSGSENQLTILFRVIPDSHKESPAISCSTSMCRRSTTTPKATPTCAAWWIWARAAITWIG